MKKLLMLFALLLPVTLSGCLPVAAIVIGATAGGAIVYDKRPFSTQMQDKGAARNAQNLLDENKTLHGKVHITVAVFNRVGLMVGQARTPELRAYAYQIVSRVRHISRIYNEVTIGPNTSMARRGNDSWITTKIKAAMLAKPGLQSTQIKVVTENGVVYLMGVISRKQSLLAANAARKVPGVRKVVKVFQYV